MANVVGGTVVWNLDADLSKFKSGMDEAKKITDTTAKRIDGSVSGLSKSIVSSMKNAEDASKQFATGFLGISTAIVGSLGIGVKTAAEFETLTTALETVTGSSDLAAKAMETIKKVAKDSPFFEVGTLAEFTQKMVAAGQSIDGAVASGIGFGDVAAAFGKGNVELERMGNTLTQVIGKGAADAVDFKELVNSGWVSVRKDTAEAMGVTMQQFEEMVSAGEVGYADIEKAASKFAGSAEKQSNSLRSLWSRLKETIATTFADVVINTGLFDQIKVGLDKVIVAIELIDAEKIKTFFNAFTDNLPLITGLIVGGLTPALYGLLTAIGANVTALAPFIIIGGLIGLLIQTLVSQFGGWKAVFEQLSAVYTQYIQPQLQDLWNTIQTQLIPAVMEFWRVVGPILTPVLEFLAKVIGAVVIVAIKLLIAIIKGLILWVTDTLNNFTKLIEFFKTIPGTIKEAFSGLANIISQPFEEAWGKIKDVAGKIKEKMMEISPFHRNSPSLVDLVQMGVAEIKDQYSSLNSLNFPSVADTSFAAVGVGSFGGADQTTNSMSQNINIEIGQVNDKADVEMISREIAFRSGVLPI